MGARLSSSAASVGTIAISSVIALRFDLAGPQKPAGRETPKHFVASDAPIPGGRSKLC
ncbi:hypothetical protein MPC4_420006 [Methylocella tundrae]|uniref:Uncharacterized protein n=1 Tax=Methylocella tundrae TaxID=227605 RepID=A0A8B6MA74_METTU|nr:hypothetical protein MPC4_420006 [Methylocella tundrae]